MDEINNVCFIISTKYYRNYPSYLKLYVDNITKFYTKSFIIIVDNNSKYIDDIKPILSNYNNLVILDNDTSCKFELGAYKVGIQYIINNNISENYEYFIFSQDTFILKNNYNFNNLLTQNIYACPLTTGNHSFWNRTHEVSTIHLFQNIIQNINLQNIIQNMPICWCNSFILHKTKIQLFLNITLHINITKRIESELSERYFGAILYILNNNKIYGIHNMNHLSYDCWTVNLINDNVKEYWVKKVQQKNENTVDN